MSIVHINTIKENSTLNFLPLFSKIKIFKDKHYGELQLNSECLKSLSYIWNKAKFMKKGPFQNLNEGNLSTISHIICPQPLKKRIPNLPFPLWTSDRMHFTDSLIIIFPRNWDTDLWKHILCFFYMSENVCGIPWDFTIRSWSKTWTEFAR